MPVVTTLCTSLPPYSPDYNPIELAFSKIKAYVRRDGTLGREPLDEAVWGYGWGWEWGSGWHAHLWTSDGSGLCRHFWWCSGLVPTSWISLVSCVAAINIRIKFCATLGSKWNSTKLHTNIFITELQNISLNQTVQHTATSLLCIIKSKTLAVDPSSARTESCSKSHKILSRHSPAPERWATLQHAACIARYLPSGNGRSVVVVKVMYWGRCIFTCYKYKLFFQGDLKCIRKVIGRQKPYIIR
jgi:hypothetical protein